MQLDHELVERVRSGDREALAIFVTRHEDLIRARFRDQFSQSQTRLNDTSDFFATVQRRFDALFASRAPGVTSASESPYETLERIMASAATDYMRAEAAARHGSEASSRPAARTGVAFEASSAPSADEAAHAALVLGLVPTDQQVLRLRSEGATHQAIAEALGMSAAAVRMRWHRIAAKLKSLSRASGA